MLATWWKYLRIAWVHEPIGQHYLRRLLVSFKFELNLFVASLANILSIGGLAMVGAVPWPATITAEIGLGIAALLLANAARGSAEVLADIRAALVKGVGIPPFDANGDPTPAA
jgi:hypothetical protein